MPLRRAFADAAVETAFERGWGELANGELVRMAESMGFTVLITTDKNLRYQQNLSGRQMAILVLWTTSWPQIRPHSESIVRAASGLSIGEFRELDPP